MIGIYKITNKINNKVYIGETMDVERRWDEHKESLKNNTHHSYKLQNDWNEYGENNFLFEVIYEVKTYSNVTNLKCFLIISEYRFMKKYNSILNGYNIENTYEKTKKQDKYIFSDIIESENLSKIFNEVDRVLNINEHIKDEDFTDGLMPIGEFCRDYFQYDNIFKNQEKCFEVIRHILKITLNDYNKYDLAKYDFDKYVILKDNKYYIKKEIKSEAVNRWLYFNINCDVSYKQNDNKKDKPKKSSKENKEINKQKPKKPKTKQKIKKYYNNKELTEVLTDIDSFNFNGQSIKFTSLCELLGINKSHVLNLVKRKFNLSYLSNENVRILADGFEIATVQSETGNGQYNTYNTLICNEDSKQLLKALIINDFEENIK